MFGSLINASHTLERTAFCLYFFAFQAVSLNISTKAKQKIPTHKSVYLVTREKKKLFRCFKFIGRVCSWSLVQGLPESDVRRPDVQGRLTGQIYRNVTRSRCATAVAQFHLV